MEPKPQETAERRQVTVMFSDLVGSMSTPKQKCIGWPEQKYISDAGKKAPELGVFSLEVKPGWDYPRARPSWRGANGACSD